MTISFADFGLKKHTKGMDICIISYTPHERQKNAELKAALQKCGFRVSFAGDINGLMKLYANNRLSFGRYSLLKELKRKAFFLFAAMVRKRNHSAESYYILTNYERNYSWLYEAAQVKLQEMGAQDRLFFYDIKSDRIIKYKKPVLGYMEYHVSWHCNLKCKGCTHYSNLFDKPLFGNLEQYRKNLLRLSELFDHIVQIKLLGGEPFLNRQIGDLVKATREVFPDTDLRIVSNGLLIPRLNDDVLEILRKYHVTIEISNYPPTANVLDKIKQRLANASIPFIVSREKHEFGYSFGGGRTNRTRQTYNHCPLKLCHFLHDDGRMSVCGIPIFYQEAKDKLKTEREVCDSDWIDLYRVADGYEVLRRFAEPIPFCGYCLDSKRYVSFPWQGNYREELSEKNL